MKRLIPLLLMPTAAFAHSGHDIVPTPQGLTHAMGHADHLAVILGAGGAALVIVAAIALFRRLRRDRP
ncbi:MAG TPA: hypothetical protein PLI13_16390 [Paracoccus sp. (in: a-proteobacteria)]|nr:hypothetical protein [Paracoccus sp. (in: a-proteobacteria)]